MKTFLPQFLDLALPLLALLGSWALYSFSNWARGHLKAQWERDLLGRFTDAIYTAVLSQKKLADELKQKAADGKLTSDEGKQLLGDAIKSVKDYMSVNGVADLRKIFDTTTLEHIIEMRVEALLANRASPVPGVVTVTHRAADLAPVYAPGALGDAPTPIRKADSKGSDS